MPVSRQLHLRRVGVEPRPDLVRHIPKGGLGGSPSKQNDQEDPDESSKDDGGGSGSDSQLPHILECLTSNKSDNQPLESSENGHLVHQASTGFFLDGFERKKNNYLR